LIAGNVLDEPSTLPSNCYDVILLKHFLDRCMWNATQTIQILKSCHAALVQSSGIFIIAEAVLPDIGAASNADRDNSHSDKVDSSSSSTDDAAAAASAASLSLSMDAMYMMVGREGQRTLQEWRDVAQASGFVIEHVQHTHIPSCSILQLRKK
jgi:hypothetical protein